MGVGRKDNLQVGEREEEEKKRKGKDKKIICPPRGSNPRPQR